ncbi:tyrosine-type recombinase/integrase [Flavobacterium ajazii]|uniref:tyrosine-type recombinase/integrase n=1 Tax=Flavobacterium ajazii TaxID=2692318 RepID=UPI0013D4B8F5|nr:tyrosine-type recombinase/integrase [Flavobacterium ajazii]
MFENTIYEFRKELENLGYCKTVIQNYPKYVQKLLEFTKESPCKTTQNHIREYYQYLQTKPNPKRTGTISQSHIKSILLAIRLFFEYLERLGKIKRNPYTLKVKSLVNNPRNILTQNEIQILYKTAQNLEETILLHLCYGCGLRRTEAQDLNIKDVNFEQKLLFVRRGKGKNRRVIPITEKITNDLQEYYKQSELYRNEKQEAFFITHQGNRIKGTTIYKTFKKLLKKAKINTSGATICLHSLRHSIATHLLENEMSIEMVRNFLGHQNLKTTQIYTRVNHLKLKQ